MKSTINFLVLIFGLLLLASFARAETPHEQLKQMVGQLQKKPDDDALREKIIKLAQTLKPAPAVPEEAERHLQYGMAAFAGAKSPEDYKEAAKEFERAALAAPWLGAAYFNLGRTQDKLENYEAALRSLALARLALPDNKNIKDWIYQVEYRDKKVKAAPKSGEAFRDCPDCPEMVVVPAGSFDMGSNNGGSDEKPVHRVTLAQPFAIGKTEVTQGQWRAVMGNNPSHFSSCGDTCPVEQVNRDDIKEFIRKLNAKTGKLYRLPSEAEWEYACRGGAQQEYCGGDNLDSVAWYGNNSGSSTRPVATKQANAFGLHDMSGNVWEWVEDSYHDSYSGAPTDGAAWGGDGAKRVLRGGSWDFRPQVTRAATRDGFEPAFRILNGGFRLARMLP